MPGHSGRHTAGTELRRPQSAWLSAGHFARAEGLAAPLLLSAGRECSRPRRECSRSRDGQLASFRRAFDLTSDGSYRTLGAPMRYWLPVAGRTRTVNEISAGYCRFPGSPMTNMDDAEYI